ncbi:hypothetical protein [Gordonia sp. (in: high G+C Gram-positive bacteria)]
MANKRLRPPRRDWARINPQPLPPGGLGRINPQPLPPGGGRRLPRNYRR